MNIYVDGLFHLIILMILLLLAMGVLNSLFWLVYGFALKDLVIFLPNFCGFLLSLFQILLCLVFPRYKYGEQVQMSEQLVNEDRDEFINNDDNARERNETLEML